MFCQEQMREINTHECTKWGCRHYVANGGSCFGSNGSKPEYRIRVDECSFCGKKISQDETVMLGCCPVCRACYDRLMRARRQ